MGGALVAATNGYYADELASGAYDQQRALDAGERVIVGVNAYQQDETVTHKRFTVDEEAERRQIDRVKSARDVRDADALATGRSATCATPAPATTT